MYKDAPQNNDHLTIVTLYIGTVDAAKRVNSSKQWINIEKHKLRERKGKTLTRNWRDHKMDRHTQTHGNCIEIFRLARPSFSIERDLYDTVSVCLCVPVLLWSLQFLVRVFTFLSLNLWYINWYGGEVS